MVTCRLRRQVGIWSAITMAKIRPRAEKGGAKHHNNVDDRRDADNAANPDAYDDRSSEASSDLV